MNCDAPYEKILEETTVRDNAGGFTRVARVPCGKCSKCKLRRVNQWMFRLNEQLKVSSHAHFLTLTYSSKHLPRSKNGFPTLKRKHWQKFMRRLRHHQPNANIKYYAVGEYGDLYKRPHYHAIIFNADPEKVALAWKKGRIECDPDVNNRNIVYCLKYIDKGSWKPAHEADDREPIFSLMSKHLGSSYMDDPVNIKWHKDDIRRSYVIVPWDGKPKKVPLPRHFRDKIYTQLERNIQRQFAENQRLTDLIEEYQKEIITKPLLSVSDFLKFKADAVIARQEKFEKDVTQKIRDFLPPKCNSTT